MIVELAIKGFIGDMVDLNTTIMSKNSDITAHTKHFTPKQNVITEDSTDEEIWKEIATSLSIKRKWQDDTVTYWSKRSQVCPLSRIRLPSGSERHPFCKVIECSQQGHSLPNQQHP